MINKRTDDFNIACSFFVLDIMKHVIKLNFNTGQEKYKKCVIFQV